ncbi:MAG: D-alanine--D-alanine ligase A, partial [Bacteroidetes bacterium]|nr:D-alanine--D-alanine ligase A [Bacteroidota bacterium]
MKPANLGSSVGISKVRDEGDFTQAIHNAFQIRHEKIII